MPASFLPELPSLDDYLTGRARRPRPRPRKYFDDEGLPEIDLAATPRQPRLPPIVPGGAERRGQHPRLRQLVDEGPEAVEREIRSYLSQAPPESILADKRAWWQSALEFLDLPRNVVANLVWNKMFGVQPTSKETFAGLRKVYGSDALQAMGWKPDSTIGKVGQFLAGLTIDFAMDPLTWLTAPLGVGRGTISATSRLIGRGGRALETAEDVAAATRAARELGRGLKIDGRLVAPKGLPKLETLAREEAAADAARRAAGAVEPVGPLFAGAESVLPTTTVAQRAAARLGPEELLRGDWGIGIGTHAARTIPLGHIVTGPALIGGKVAGLAAEHGGRLLQRVPTVGPLLGKPLEWAGRAAQWPVDVVGRASEAIGTPFSMLPEANRFLAFRDVPGLGQAIERAERALAGSEVAGRIGAGLRQIGEGARAIAEKVGIAPPGKLALLARQYLEQARRSGAQDEASWARELDALVQATATELGVNRTQAAAVLASAKEYEGILRSAAESGDPARAREAIEALTKHFQELLPAGAKRAATRTAHEIVKALQIPETPPPRPAGADIAPGRVEAGQTLKAFDREGGAYPVRLEIVEAGSLAPSHLPRGAGVETLEPNAAYPAGFQARDRARAASIEQVRRIASEPEPALLIDDLATLAGGPPTIADVAGRGNVVVQGNGRVAGMLGWGKRQWSAYRAALRERGYAIHEGVDHPVLVRRLLGGEDDARRAAALGQTASTLSLTSIERARSELRGLGLERVDDLPPVDVREPITRDNVQGFLDRNAAFRDALYERLPEAARATLRAAPEELARRVNDVFLAALPEPAQRVAGLSEAHERMILAAAPQLATLHGLAQRGVIRPEYDVYEVIGESARMFERIQGRGGKSLQAVLDELEDMASTPTFAGFEDWAGSIDRRGVALALGLHRAARAANPAESFVDSLNKVLRAALADDPRQQGLIGAIDAGEESARAYARAFGTAGTLDRLTELGRRPGPRPSVPRDEPPAGAMAAPGAPPEPAIGPPPPPGRGAAQGPDPSERIASLLGDWIGRGATATPAGIVAWARRNLEPAERQALFGVAKITASENRGAAEDLARIALLRAGRSAGRVRWENTYARLQALDRLGRGAAPRGTGAVRYAGLEPFTEADPQSGAVRGLNELGRRAYAAMNALLEAGDQPHLAERLAREVDDLEKRLEFARARGAPFPQTERRRLATKKMVLERLARRVADDPAMTAAARGAGIPPPPGQRLPLAVPTPRDMFAEPVAAAVEKMLEIERRIGAMPIEASTADIRAGTVRGIGYFPHYLGRGDTWIGRLTRRGGMAWARELRAVEGGPPPRAAESTWEALAGVIERENAGRAARGEPPIELRRDAPLTAELARLIEQHPELTPAHRSQLMRAFGRENLAVELNDVANVTGVQFETDPVRAWLARAHAANLAQAGADFLQAAVRLGVDEGWVQRVPLKGRTPEGFQRVADERLGTLLTFSERGRKFTYALRDDVAAELSRFARRSAEPGPVLRAWDWATSKWKTLVLSVPAYTMTNLLSGVFQANQFGAFRYRTWSAAERMMRDFHAGGETLTRTVASYLPDLKREEFGRMTVREFVELLSVEHGALGKGLYGSEMESIVRQGMRDDWSAARAAREAYETWKGRGRAGRIVAAPVDAARAYFGMFRAANVAVEDWMKISFILERLRRGDDVGQAVQKGRLALNQSADLTDFEKATFRRLIPFWGWVKGNAVLQFMLATARPQVTALVPKIRGNLEASFAGEATLPPSLRPQHVGGELGAQLGGGPSPNFLNLTRLFPVRELGLTPAAGLPAIGAMGEQALQSLHPFLRMPLETVINRDLYWDRPIESYEGQRRRFLGVDLPVQAKRVAQLVRPLNILEQQAWRGVPTDAGSAVAAAGQAAGLRLFPVDVRRQVLERGRRIDEQLAAVMRDYARARTRATDAGRDWRSDGEVRRLAGIYADLLATREALPLKFLRQLDRPQARQRRAERAELKTFALGGI